MWPVPLSSLDILSTVARVDLLTSKYQSAPREIPVYEVIFLKIKDKPLVYGNSYLDQFMDTGYVTCKVLYFNKSTFGIFKILHTLQILLLINV